MAPQPLREPIGNSGSSTALTPLSPALRHQLQAAAVALRPPAADAVDLAISQAIAKLTPEPEPPAALAPPPQPTPPAALGPRPWLLRGLAGGLALSLIGNVCCALALRGAQLSPRPSRPGPGMALAQSPSAASPSLPPAPSLCVRNSTQTITGPERDRLLLAALREYESGRRAAALQLLTLYVSEACDAATLQAVAILERELAPPSKELANAP